MLNLGHSIWFPAVFHSSFVASNAETNTFIAALTGTYPKSLKQAWDDAIGALKTSGAWADFDILYIKGAIPGTSAANIADGYLNWKNPATFTLIPVNSPTNGNGYWQGDGASSRFRTQYTPSADGVTYVQGSASIWFYSLTDIQSNSHTIGNGSVNPKARIAPRTTTNLVAGHINDETQLTAANAASTGLFGVQRRGSTDLRLWRNGSQVGSTSATASTGVPTQEQWVCGANSTAFATNQIALAAWGASQSGREAGINTVFQNLLTAAGTI
jgi:hypothetical protein